MTYLAHAVRTAARRHGANPALVAGRGPVRLTFEQLNAASEALAARLAVRGVGAGQVAALLLPPSLDYVVAYCALAKVGAITAGVGASYSDAERQAMLDRVRPHVVIGSEDLLTGHLPDAQIIPVRPVRDRREFAAGLPILGRDPSVPRPAVRVDAQRADAHRINARRTDARHGTRTAPDHTHRDPETIVFTSGTTGLPKGALFCASQVQAVADADTAAQSGPTPLLVATGLHHVGFMTKLAGHLLAGNRLHILERWRAADALDLICAERVSVIGGVASQVALLLRVPGLDERDLSAVRALVIGGGPSPADLVRRAREAFGAAYSIRYSSTESGGLGTLTAFDAPDEELFHTVGRPRPGTEVSVRDEAGAQVPAGTTGEVWLRGPATMAEYWHDPEATVRALTPDGWLRTGDLGRLDERGLLRLDGRRDDMFIRGGHNVHPQEVEAVLQEYPAVAEVAVVPRDDPVMGQVGVAVVVPSGPGADLSLDGLRGFAARRLARHKIPEDLRIVESLPLTSGQKVDRSALRKLVGG
jgi:acyl-CoA synthetase (AMP-forming)/AMP-acid ligase II